MRAEIPDEPTPSLHLRLWWGFAGAVENHIENYVIPQYGDADSDMAQDYDATACIEQAKKYIGRFGKNMRPGQEELDLLKAADYLMMAWHKMREQKNANRT